MVKKRGHCMGRSISHPAMRAVIPRLRKLTQWLSVSRNTISAPAPAIHGSLACTKPCVLSWFDILGAEPVETIREEVGKFVSEDGMLLGWFFSQTHIGDTLYMLGLREHVERLYSCHFIDSPDAENVQVPRQGGWVAGYINDLVGASLS